MAASGVAQPLPPKPFRVGLAPRPAVDDDEAEWPYFLIYSPQVGVPLEE